MNPLDFLTLLAINGSDLIDQPWNTTFMPFIRLLGQGWVIVPLGFIGAALFVKTRDTALIALYLIMIGAFIGIASIWGGFTEAALMFFVMAAIGVAVLMYNVFYGGK